MNTDYRQIYSVQNSMQGDWIVQPFLIPRQYKQETNTYKVLFLNDVHFSKSRTINGTRHYYTSPDLMRKTMDEYVPQLMPDSIFLLGDMCDWSDDWKRFKNIYNKNLSRAAQVIPIVGNHDFDVTSYGELLDIFDLHELRENGGSKFNQSFKVSANIRVITIDVNFDEEDKHTNKYWDMRMHTESVGWLEDELTKSKEDIVLILSHHAPMDHLSNRFDRRQGDELKQVVDKVASKKPTMKMFWFFGHHHVTQIVCFDKWHDRCVGYLLPAMVEEEDGRFSFLEMKDNGEYKIKQYNISI